MKMTLKTLAAAAAFVAAGVANAGTITLPAGGSVSDSNFDFSGLSGSGTLTFSSTLIGALNAGGVQVAQVDPAIVTTTTTTPTSSKYKTVTAAAPVTSLNASFNGTSLAVNTVGTAGGALQTAVDDGFTTTGGSLAITNLKVDLNAKKVFATLVGANGVGTINNLDLWDIATVSGATSFTVPAGGGVLTSTNTLSGLKINANAFSLFSQALGLTAAGNNALATVTDFGSISSSISLTATPAVPEPSTYLMMVAGLAAVGMTARRRGNKA